MNPRRVGAHADQQLFAAGTLPQRQQNFVLGRLLHLVDFGAEGAGEQLVFEF